MNGEYTIYSFHVESTRTVYAHAHTHACGRKLPKVGSHACIAVGDKERGSMMIVQTCFFIWLLSDTPIRLALGVGKGRIYIHLHLHLFSLLLSWSLCVSSFWDRRRWRHDDSPPHAKSNGCHMYTFPCINMHLLPKMKSILFKINPHAIRTAAYAGRQTVTPLAALQLWRLADRESLPRWAVN
jgi:hypothetical protein